MHGIFWCHTWALPCSGRRSALSSGWRRTAAKECGERRNSTARSREIIIEINMTSAKLIVAYPQPKDVDAFEAVYQREHVPMAIANLEGKTKMVATKVLLSPQGEPQFYRIAEVHFPSMEALNRCAASAGGQATLANALKISSGGPPVIMVAEEDTFTF
jgi:uncharacterized protein (TIGR02118 family)